MHRNSEDVFTKQERIATLAKQSPEMAVTSLAYPDSGSPQGGVVSPLISNVFLHYVLDLWFEQEVKPRLRGQAFLIRYWVVKLKTASDRFTRAVRRIDQWCHDNRHLPLTEQQQTLNQKLRGHYAYYGVTGNSDAMNRFRQEVENRWRKWLNRRNNIRSMHWQKFCALLRRYPLAPARAMRSTLRQAAKP